MGESNEDNGGSAASPHDGASDFDPFENERFAPEGWTLEAVALLKRYFEGDPDGGAQYFTRCPASTAAKVIALLEQACPEGPQHFVYDEGGVSSVQLVKRAQSLRGARLRGVIIDPGRWDERIDFTSLCH